MIIVSEKSCSWCHAMNPAQAPYCAYCGHQAGKPRAFCQCLSCVSDSVGALNPYQADYLAAMKVHNETDALVTAVLPAFEDEDFEDSEKWASAVDAIAAAHGLPQARARVMEAEAALLGWFRRQMETVTQDANALALFDCRLITVRTKLICMALKAH